MGLLSSDCAFTASDDLKFSFPASYSEHGSLDLVGFQCGKIKCTSLRTSEITSPFERILQAADWVSDTPEVKRAYAPKDFIKCFLLTLICGYYSLTADIAMDTCMDSRWENDVFLEFAKDWTNHLMENKESHQIQDERLENYLQLSLDALGAYIVLETNPQDQETNRKAVIDWKKNTLTCYRQIVNPEEESTEVIVRLPLLEEVVSNQFIDKFNAFGANRKIFITDENEMGMGSIGMQKGDIVTILHGSRVPLVLRPLPSLYVTEYQLVGDCYIQGIMHGEAVSRLRERGVLESRTQTFSLR
jgi:hypothetical protein